MSNEKQLEIQDFGFVPRSLDFDNEMILLRIVEGARVAIIKTSAMAEILPTRGDLFNYAGGYAWGYGGSGPLNLAHAIAGHIFDVDGFDKANISQRAHHILREVVSMLTGDEQHDLEVAHLRGLFDDLRRKDATTETQLLF